MNKIDVIRKINKNIVHEDGTIDSFDKQIIDLLSGEFDLTKPLIINSDSSSIPYVDLIWNDLPLVMNVSTFIKLQNKHFLSLGMIRDIEKHLKNSVLAIESMTENESVVIITDLVSNVTNEPYIVTCRYEKKIGMIRVNEITSFYDRRKFENFLINTYEQDKEFYKSKKIEQYLHLNRLQLPQELQYALSNSYFRNSFTKSQVDDDLQNMHIQFGDYFGTWSIIREEVWDDNIYRIYKNDYLDSNVCNYIVTDVNNEILGEIADILDVYSLLECCNFNKAEIDCYAEL